MNDNGHPTKFHEIFPKKYLEAAELGGVPRTVTIDHVEFVEIANEDGEVKRAGLLFFRNARKQMVMNMTNGKCLVAMFGDDLVAWRGKRVTLKPAKDKLGGKEVDCIRIAGSPDLQRDIEFELKLPRKKPRKIRLTKTVEKSTQGAEPSAPPAPAPDQAEPQEQGSDDGS